MNTYHTIYQADPLNPRLIELAHQRSLTQDDPITEAYLDLVEANMELEALLDRYREGDDD